MKVTMRAAHIAGLAALMASIAPAGRAFGHAPQFRKSPTVRARRAARVSDWNLASANYWWLSPHRVLFLRGAWKKGWTYYRIDIRSGKEEPLHEISSLVRRCWGNAQSVSLAPDRKTLLLDCMKSNLRAVDIRAHPRFPDHLAYPEGGPFSSIAYMGADSDWVEALFPYPVGTGHMSGLVLHDGKRQKVTREVTFDPPLIMPGEATLTARNHFVFATVGRGSTPRGPVSYVKVTDVDLNKNKPIVKTHNVPLPKTMFNVSEIMISPRADKVAWLVEPPPVIPGNGVSRVRTKRRFEIWTSSIRGARMKKVGLALYRWTKLGPQGRLTLRWLPDGRTLSYVQNDSLWTTPAD